MTLPLLVSFKRTPSCLPTALYLIVLFLTQCSPNARGASKFGKANPLPQTTFCVHRITHYSNFGYYKLLSQSNPVPEEPSRTYMCSPLTTPPSKYPTSWVQGGCWYSRVWEYRMLVQPFHRGLIWAILFLAKIFCNTVVTRSAFSPQLSLLPGIPYDPNMYCTWTFHRASHSIMAPKVTEVFL